MRRMQSLCRRDIGRVNSHQPSTLQPLLIRQGSGRQTTGAKVAPVVPLDCLSLVEAELVRLEAESDSSEASENLAQFAFGTGAGIRRTAGTAARAAAGG